MQAKNGRRSLSRRCSDRSTTARPRRPARRRRLHVRRPGVWRTWRPSRLRTEPQPVDESTSGISWARRSTINARWQAGDCGCRPARSWTRIIGAVLDQAASSALHQTKKGNEWHFGMKLHIGLAQPEHDRGEHRRRPGRRRRRTRGLGRRRLRAASRTGGRVAGRDARRRRLARTAHSPSASALRCASSSSATTSGLAKNPAAGVARSGRVATGLNRFGLRPSPGSAPHMRPTGPSAPPQPHAPVAHSPIDLFRS